MGEHQAKGGGQALIAKRMRQKAVDIMRGRGRGRARGRGNRARGRGRGGAAQTAQRGSAGAASATTNSFRPQGAVTEEQDGTKGHHNAMQSAALGGGATFWLQAPAAVRGDGSSWQPGGAAPAVGGGGHAEARTALFVKGLPLGAGLTEQHLRAHFEQFGKVERVLFKQGYSTASVFFVSQADAIKAKGHGKIISLASGQRVPLKLFWYARATQDKQNPARDRTEKNDAAGSAAQASTELRPSAPPFVPDPVRAQTTGFGSGFTHIPFGTVLSNNAKVDRPNTSASGAQPLGAFDAPTARESPFPATKGPGPGETITPAAGIVGVWGGPQPSFPSQTQAVQPGAFNSDANPSIGLRGVTTTSFAPNMSALGAGSSYLATTAARQPHGRTDAPVSSTRQSTAAPAPSPQLGTAQALSASVAVPKNPNPPSSAAPLPLSQPREEIPCSGREDALAQATSSRSLSSRRFPSATEPADGRGANNSQAVSFPSQPDATLRTEANAGERSDRFSDTLPSERRTWETVERRTLADAQTLRGRLMTMCSEDEARLREKAHEISIFERRRPFQRGEPVVVDLARCVKKYKRSAAAAEDERPEDVRPPAVLRMTMNYLIDSIMDDQTEPFSEVQLFVRDRMRAIRKDFTCQNVRDETAVEVHEQMVRFHILCGHRLCEEERAVFDPKQNQEQLNNCLTTLKEMYADFRKAGKASCPNEVEFLAYDILARVHSANDVLHACMRLPDDILSSAPIRRALRAFSLVRSGDFSGFFKYLREAPYLEACTLHAQVAPMRARALVVLARASPKGKVSLELALRGTACDTAQDIMPFIEAYNGVLDAQNVLLDTKSMPTSTTMPVKRLGFVERKSASMSIASIVRGPDGGAGARDSQPPTVVLSGHPVLGDARAWSSNAAATQSSPCVVQTQRSDELQRIERERKQRETIERERLQREHLERQERERLQREHLERQERERQERERLQREREEKERLERERQERERVERERREQERLERERQERERLERERQERERLERERREQERLERERQERERQERERLRRERALVQAKRANALRKIFLRILVHKWSRVAGMLADARRARARWHTAVHGLDSIALPRRSRALLFASGVKARDASWGISSALSSAKILGESRRGLMIPPPLVPDPLPLAAYISRSLPGASRCSFSIAVVLVGRAASTGTAAAITAMVAEGAAADALARAARAPAVLQKLSNANESIAWTPLANYVLENDLPVVPRQHVSISVIVTSEDGFVREVEHGQMCKPQPADVTKSAESQGINVYGERAPSSRTRGADSESAARLSARDVVFRTRNGEGDPQPSARCSIRRPASLEVLDQSCGVGGQEDILGWSRAPSLQSVCSGCDSVIVLSDHVCAESPALSRLWGGAGVSVVRGGKLGATGGPPASSSANGSVGQSRSPFGSVAKARQGIASMRSTALPQRRDRSEHGDSAPSRGSEEVSSAFEHSFAADLRHRNTGGDVRGERSDAYTVHGSSEVASWRACVWDAVDAGIRARRARGATRRVPPDTAAAIIARAVLAACQSVPSPSISIVDAVAIAKAAAGALGKYSAAGSRQVEPSDTQARHLHQRSATGAPSPAKVSPTSDAPMTLAELERQPRSYADALRQRAQSVEEFSPSAATGDARRSLPWSLFTPCDTDSSRAVSALEDGEGVALAARTLAGGLATLPLPLLRAVEDEARNAALADDGHVWLRTVAAIALARGEALEDDAFPLLATDQELLRMEETATAAARFSAGQLRVDERLASHAGKRTAVKAMDLGSPSRAQRRRIGGTSAAVDLLHALDASRVASSVFDSRLRAVISPSASEAVDPVMESTDRLTGAARERAGLSLQEALRASLRSSRRATAAAEVSLCKHVLS